MHRLVVKRSVNAALQQLFGKSVAVFVDLDNVLDIDVIALFDRERDVRTVCERFAVGGGYLLAESPVRSYFTPISITS